MKKGIFFILFLILNAVSAAPDVHVYYEKTDEGYSVYCDNNSFCEISITFDFELKNLALQNEDDVYIVKRRDRGFLVTELKIIDKYQAYSFQYTYNTCFGNHVLREYDFNYEYYLPYEKGKRFYVSQGYNGKYSHKNENALDFTMPEGTPVCAIRDGVVVDVVTKNSFGCPSKKCVKLGNYITVRHKDGTFVNYYHLKKNGAVVKLGFPIKKSQIIGYSGNTGWSTHPHLHLSVFLPRFHKYETLKTKFLINEGDKAIFLDEKKGYKRNY